MKQRPELAAFALAAVVVAGAVVLAVTNNAIPAWFPILAVGALTGGTGLAPGPAPAEAASSDTLSYVSDTVDGLAAAVDAVQTDLTALRRRSVIGPVGTPSPAPSEAQVPAPPPVPAVPAPASPPPPAAAPAP